MKEIVIPKHLEARKMTISSAFLNTGSHDLKTTVPFTSSSFLVGYPPGL